MVALMIAQPSNARNCVRDVLVQISFKIAYDSCVYVYKASADSSILLSRTAFEESGSRNYVYTSEAVGNAAEFQTNSSEYSLVRLFSGSLRTVYGELCSVWGLRQGYTLVATTESNEELELPVSEQNTAPSEAKIAPEVAVGVKSLGTLPGGQVDMEAGPPDLPVMYAAEPVVCPYFLLLNVGARYVASYSRSAIVINPLGKYALLLTLVVVPFVFLYNFVVSLLGNTCVFPNSYGAEPWIPGLSCLAEHIYVWGTLLTLTMYLQFLLGCIAMLVAVIGMLYGSLVLRAMASSWVKRYGSLRQSLSQDMDVTEVGGASGDPSALPSNFCALLKTDAFEHYLFMQEYVRQISAVWGPLVLVLVLLSAAIFVYAMYYVIFASELIILPTAGVFLVTLSFPIYCLANANAAIETIRESFVNQCSPTNFEVIGGRELWVSYLAESPAYWTLFGLAITWNTLYSVLGSLLGSALLAFASIFIQ